MTSVTSFFGELRTQWSPQLDEHGDPSSLRYLIERMNPQNYIFEERDGERVIVGFQWPEELKKDADESLAGLAKTAKPLNVTDALSLGA